MLYWSARHAGRYLIQVVMRKVHLTNMIYKVEWVHFQGRGGGGQRLYLGVRRRYPAVARRPVATAFLGGVTERPSIRWRLIRFLRENRPDLEKKITCERLLDLHDEEYPLVAPW